MEKYIHNVNKEFLCKIIKGWWGGVGLFGKSDIPFIGASLSCCVCERHWVSKNLFNAEAVECCKEDLYFQRRSRTGCMW